jgi:hypothetical protein
MGKREKVVENRKEVLKPKGYLLIAHKAAIARC